MSADPISPEADIPLQMVLDRLQAAASLPFEQAVPIPGVVNHSREFHSHERQSVFLQEWVCIGRSDEVQSPGDFLTHDIAGVPVLVVRQKDLTLRAFVNACAHRFACLTPEKSGNTKRFMCRYHAWTYDLDGRLVRAPKMEMAKEFDASQHGLRPLKTETWEGFVYVSLAETPAKSLAEALAPLTENIVGQFDMGCYRTVLRQTMRWGANWKNLIENFTESYHVPFAHQKTFAKHQKPLDVYVVGEDSDHYCYHRAAQDDETGSGAAHPANDRLSGEWRRMMVDFCIFPCQLITLMPDFLWWISVQPDGVGAFDATWGVAVPREVLADAQAGDYDKWLADMHAYMDVANGEDELLVEALYRGTASPMLPTGALHPIERNLWQFTRYLAQKCGNTG